MKKTIFVLLFLFLPNLMYAQRTVKKGGQVKDLNLQKFVGAWQWTNGHDTLKIIFEKRKVYFEKPDAYIDMIIGWHKYVDDGTGIENSLDLAGTSYQSSTISGNTKKKNTDKLELLLNDSKGYYLHNATFKLIPGQTDRAILKIRYSEGVTSEDNVTEIPIPSTWKMKRIE